jgi:deoxyribose-phosphate aldolase
MDTDPTDLAARLQHADLRLEATQADIEQLLADCVEHGLHGAVVNPIWLPLASRMLEGTGVRLCTLLDAPAGGGTTASVARAAGEARRAGAEEIEVMTKVGWLRSKMDVAYRMHLAAVVRAAEGAPVRAVLEAPLLHRGELALAVELCADAGAAFVQDSSGLDGEVPSPRLVGELARLARGRMGVKASGAVDGPERARALLLAGADLLGSPRAVELLRGWAEGAGRRAGPAPPSSRYRAWPFR